MSEHPLAHLAGDFETHLTLDAPTPERVERAATWAAEHGLKFTHIELDRGETPSQPMVTRHSSGLTLAGELAEADRLSAELAADGLPVIRVKVEMGHWAAGVPRTEEEAAGFPSWCYFESHVKLLLPARTDLDALTRIARAHGARLSRNARRVREDGRQERFVTQRCSGVGNRTASRLEDLLWRELALSGVEQNHTPGTDRPRFLSVEREFVVHDSALEVDAGWLDADPERVGEPRRDAFDLSGSTPSTLIPNTGGPHARQEKVFDPALKHYGYAVQAGDPVFDDPGLGERWWDAQGRALAAALAAVAATPWRDSLVLRGSMVMPVWLGAAARRPRDLDFVVVPEDVPAFGDPADRMFADLTGALGGADRDGIVFDGGGIAAESIWTYERAPGRRLVVPWRAEGLPAGTVQLDVVFGEPLPRPPVAEVVAGSAVRVADPAASLLWKVLWLFTDLYPQPKDLYDAVLLAGLPGAVEGLSVAELRELMREDLGRDADTADERYLRTSLRRLANEWPAFAASRPAGLGGPQEWVDRFEAALRPAFARG